MVLLINREPSLSEGAMNSENNSSDPNQIHKTLERIIWTDVAANRKVVFKVYMEGQKGGKKAINALTGLSGIYSISVDGKQQKLTVIGSDIDAVLAVRKLRRKVGLAELISVGPAKEETVEGKKEEAVPSSVTERARGKKKVLAEKAPMDDATVSSTGQLLQSMNISSQAGASASLSMSIVEDSSFPQWPFTVMLDQDRAKDVMVERKRLLNEQEMSIKRIVELEGLLATQKALLTTEVVVLEELVAKDEQLEELKRALEGEKKKNAEFAFVKENDYLKGVANCRLKMLERYPELDLSWMEAELRLKSDTWEEDVPDIQEHK